MTYVDFRTLTWPEAAALGASSDVLGVVCLAALEQHGPALPLATDALIGSELARLLAERFTEPVVVMPVPEGGLSNHHLGFPGSVSFSASTLRGILDAYVDALVRTGISNVFVFTSHGGNFAFLSEVEHGYAGREDVRLFVYADRDAYFGTTFTGARAGGFDPVETDWHAGGIETSQGLHSFPEHVRPFDEVRGYTTAEPGWLDKILAEGLRAVSESGVLGDPRGANPSAGAAIFDALVELLAERVESELGWQRR